MKYHVGNQSSAGEKNVARNVTFQRNVKSISRVEE
jgi:hypothetical protein